MAKEYKDQILDTSVNEKRVYNIVDSDGNIVAENVSLEDKTVYSQEGTEFGAQEVNEIYEAIDEVNSSLTLDFTNASHNVQDVNTLLQKLLDRFFPSAFYLFKDGEIKDGYTLSKAVQNGDVSITGGMITVVSNNGVSIAGIEVDLTNFSTLKFQAKTNGTRCVLGITSTFELTTSYAVYQEISSTGLTDIEIDVSDYLGNYYICGHAYTPDSNPRIVYISEIELK